MATLYNSGHDITLSWSAERLAEIVRPDWHGCKVGRLADIMFTDLHGFNQLQSSLNSVSKFKCILRILDVFGTEAAYNHYQYSKKKGLENMWGGRNLCGKTRAPLRDQFFPDSQTQQLASLTCRETYVTDEIYAPSYEPNRRICHVQKDPLLFSCAGDNRLQRRLCPCRDFLKDQVALCKDCT